MDIYKNEEGEKSRRHSNVIEITEDDIKSKINEYQQYQLYLSDNGSTGK